MPKNPLFMVIGRVRKGAERGRVLGFPTANVPCPSALTPGIYAGEVQWNGTTYPAALYKEKGKEILEVHLLDFKGELYRERLICVAYKKIREPKQFDTETKLIAAMQQDIQIIRACLQE